jgi:hypothetical protein
MYRFLMYRLFPLCQKYFPCIMEWVYSQYLLGFYYHHVCWQCLRLLISRPAPGFVTEHEIGFFRCRVDALWAGGGGGHGLPASWCSKGEVFSDHTLVCFFEDGLLFSSCSLISCNLILSARNFILVLGFGYHYLLMKLPLFMVLQDCIGVLSKQFPGSVRVSKFS